jgi:hypothetical protein
MAKDDKGGSGGGPKKLMVSINSLDGNIPHHPFNTTDTIGDVRKFAYGKLVQQKAQITLDRTWIEFSGDRIDDATLLGALANPDDNSGSQPDLTLSLAWDTSGG